MKFIIDGKTMSAGKFGDSLMDAVVRSVKTAIRDQISAIRHPETGEFPTVVANGDSLDTIHYSVEGSAELLEIVRSRLGPSEMANTSFNLRDAPSAPKAFLSFSFADKDLAERLARALTKNGIETWWAGWEIRAGDSLRQKIDEGLGGCTHFLVLLTPSSIQKPWVKQEMDAGLIRRLEKDVRFIPIRSNLPYSSLPPLLSGMYSPDLSDFDSDAKSIVNDIFEISRRPTLGSPPMAAMAKSAGYSPAAGAVARIFVVSSEHGLFGDPQLSISELSIQAKLPVDDVRDALYELKDYFTVSGDWVLPKEELFVIFDQYHQGWTPSADALRLATDLLHDESFPYSPVDIAERYGWVARRLNPAISYLINRGMLLARSPIYSGDWVSPSIQPRRDEVRRFVKSRS